MIYIENKWTLDRTDFESEDFGIWDSFGLRVDINVLVLPGEVSRYQLSGLWTLAGGCHDK